MPYFSGSAVMAVAAALASALWKARLAAAPGFVAIVSMAAGSSARVPSPESRVMTESRFRSLPHRGRFRDCDMMGHVNNAVYLTTWRSRFAYWRAAPDASRTK